MKYTVRLLGKREKDAVYLWHLQLANFSRSFPSWERAEILSVEEVPPRQVRFHILFRKAVSAVFRVQYPLGSSVIRLVQEKGPLQKFDMQIEVRPLEENGCELVEKIEYELKYPGLFPKTRKKHFERWAKRFFEYKHEVMQKDLERVVAPEQLRILVNGTHGLIGSSLVELLQAMGHDVVRLVRKPEDKKFSSDIVYGADNNELEGFDACIHLWGRSIQSRWTKKVEKEVLNSRQGGTKELVDRLLQLKRPPKAFLSASAIGYYGNLDGGRADESSPKGRNSFLANVCQAWEGASHVLEKRGIRVVHLRFGAVLSSKKGALYELLKAAKWGLCGTLGRGDQFLSWIAIDDVVGAIHHVLLHKNLEGPVNITSPYPISNLELVKRICSHTKKSLGPQLPPAFLRLIKGKLVDEVLLSSARVVPKKLLESGYNFRYPHIEEAISHLIY